jgi:hypothetical protein
MRVMVVDPFAGDEIEERDGRLVVPRMGSAIDDDMVTDLRDADQRRQGREVEGTGPGTTGVSG